MEDLVDDAERFPIAGLPGEIDGGALEILDRLLALEGGALAFLADSLGGLGLVLSIQIETDALAAPGRDPSRVPASSWAK